jgi:acetyltransferase
VEAFRLLDSFNIPVVPTVLARSADEAATAADRMGFPVVLKIESLQITHKSDVGGVALRLEPSASNSHKKQARPYQLSYPSIPKIAS